MYPDATIFQFFDKIFVCIRLYFPVQSLATSKSALLLLMRTFQICNLLSINDITGNDHEETGLNGGIGR